MNPFVIEGWSLIWVWVPLVGMAVASRAGDKLNADLPAFVKERC